MSENDNKVRLVIELSQEDYKIICSDKGYAMANTMWWVIRNGTPITEGDMISRSALRERKTPQVEIIGGRHNGKTKEQIVEAYQKGWNDCIDAIIDNAPTVAERPQGEWKEVNGYDGDVFYECNQCGEPWILNAGTPEENNMNFCPNCGADMRGGADMRSTTPTTE